MDKTEKVQEQKTETQQTEVQKPKTWLDRNMQDEHEAVSGGPADPIIAEASADESAPNSSEEAPAPESAPNSESSSEPASQPANTTEFSQTTFGAEAKSEQNQESAKEVDDPLTKLPKDVLTRLLTEPESIVAEIEAKTLAKIQQSDQTKKQAEAAWKDFYQKNPDLEASRELVDLVTQKLNNQWRSEGKTVSWVEGSKRLAEEARRLVQTIRDSNSDEVDTRRRAPTVSSSGLSAPRGVTKPVEQPKTFAEQLRSYQRKIGVGRVKGASTN